MSRAIRTALAVLWTALLPTGLAASQDDANLAAIASWVAVDAASGYETRVAPALAAALEGWSADEWGNLVTRVGAGEPRRVIACALDRPSYAVSQITEDGYLRVHRIGFGSRHPLWDQAFEAQQVRVLTPEGPVAGVVARNNGHFARQHRNETEVITADGLWVDVGANSAAEVAALGIGLLDPIGRHLPPWSFASEVAGPDVGRRAGCAAVATLARSARNDGAEPGEIIFVLSARQVFGWIGLSSLIARGGPVDELVVLAPGQATGVDEFRPAESLGRLGTVLDAVGISRVRWIVPSVRSPGAHMERLDLQEATTLLLNGARAVGVRIDPPFSWVVAPPRAPLRAAGIDPSLAPVADLLSELVELPGVSGHESSVRRYVLERLPAWARDRAVVDDMGNVMVEAGPDGDAVVFMAHMDEVGYEIESIAPDGVVTLNRRGGAVSSAWEGQTALVHFDPIDAPSLRRGDGTDMDPRWKRQSLAAEAAPPLRGVFLTREVAEQRNPEALSAWFGMDAQALAQRGVRPGMAVASHKEGLRLGPTRFVSRALDDRAGTTALLLAINAIDPERLASRVVFAWSVGEEIGLFGAAAMARRFGGTTQRIYSVDTFVSSDTPLESPHFAFTPLGSGPVLRAIESSGVSPDRERARVFRAAERAGIPLQMGLTQGGTDGTWFTFWGAPNQGLSWPGRYSHSPGEVLDLRDLASLSKLIVSLATGGGS